MVSARFPHGFRTVSARFPHGGGFPHGFRTVSARFPHGFRTVSAWRGGCHELINYVLVAAHATLFVFYLNHFRAKYNKTNQSHLNWTKMSFFDYTSIL